MVEMGLLVPEDLAVLDVRPVVDFPLRQPPIVPRAFHQLHERFGPVKQSRRRIGGKCDPILRELQPVRLARERLAALILRLAHRRRARMNFEPDGGSAAPLR